ncbi:hypothetical protein vBEcoMphAPEC6_gp143c [Escherichia phage vB_EcoM_phAPEC6]|nr:hypothetical protein vBEcoMphAPEC6_gp143c [Escherichia phage vB_EcoM_phAPEC6]
MNGKLLALIGILVVIVLMVFGSISMYVGAHDRAVEFEGNIKKYYDASESQLSNYTLTIQDKVQVADKYKNALKETIESYFKGREGVDQKFVMSQIQQQVPNLDPKIYQELMVTIETGRTKFNNLQKMKIDQCTDYAKFRKGFWNSKILDSNTFPSENIEHLCTVVSDTRTKKAMDTGIQESIKL